MSPTQAGILLLQSVILGLLTEYFNIDQPTQEDTRNAYLYALSTCVIIIIISTFLFSVYAIVYWLLSCCLHSGLVTLALVVVVMHSHSFLIGQKMSMMLRLISTAAIYKKVNSYLLDYQDTILTICIVRAGYNTKWLA